MDLCSIGSLRFAFLLLLNSAWLLLQATACKFSVGCSNLDKDLVYLRIYGILDARKGKEKGVADAYLSDCYGHMCAQRSFCQDCLDTAYRPMNVNGYSARNREWEYTYF